MKLTSNPFTKALKSGKPQIGLWSSTASNYCAEVIAPSGFDWVVIDMEHAPNDLSTVLSQLQVFEASESTAIVRLDWNDPVKVKRLLDLGAPGLVFPMIGSVAEAEAAVAATRYPPRGVRGVAGATRASKFGRVTDYAARVEEETTIIIQVETLDAIANVVEIGSVDGVSGVFFGPADISADMGLMGQTRSEKMWDEVIWPAARKLIAKGIPVGTLVLDPDFAHELIAGGFNFVACGLDTVLLAKASDELRARMALPG